MLSSNQLLHYDVVFAITCILHGFWRSNSDTIISQQKRNNTVGVGFHGVIIDNILSVFYTFLGNWPNSFLD
jgi:hypothetical protein